MLTSRHAQLCCALSDLSMKLGSSNRLDVFVFSVDDGAKAVFNTDCARQKLNITVVFLPLEEHWSPTPDCSSSAIHNAEDWVARQFDKNYRNMGHWRLAFQFAFADVLGYKYLWQLDDDSFFPEPVTVDMLAFMQKNDLWIAGRQTMSDPHFVTWGLPELARLFLVGERMDPAGTLFTQHTQPPGLDGLYTIQHNPGMHANQAELRGDAGGWSRTIIHGNCVIMDIEKFWWPKQTQKFVELVLQSGYHWRFRWNEQAVIAMVWQLFVPEKHFRFNSLPFAYQHPNYWEGCEGGKNKSCCHVA